MKTIIVAALLSLSFSSFAKSKCLKSYNKRYSDDITNIIAEHDFSKCSNKKLEKFKERLNDHIVRLQKDLQYIRLKGTNLTPEKQAELMNEITAAKTSLILITNQLYY